MKTLWSIIFILSLFISNIYGNIKNLYIIIEPHIIEKEKDEVKTVLVPTFKNLTQIGKWITENRAKPKFKNVFIRVAGGNSYQFKKKSLDRLSKRKTFVQIYKDTKEIEEYSISKTLAYFPQDLRLKKWKGEETLLLIMGDVNFVKNGISSYGKYLNSYWLESENSIFVKYFLSKDNQPAKDTSVIVLTQTQLSLIHEKMRRDFIINLLSNERVGMRLYYVGEIYNLFSAPSSLKSTDTYLLELLKKVKQGEKAMLKRNELPKTSFCQIVGLQDSINVRNCGGE